MQEFPTGWEIIIKLIDRLATLNKQDLKNDHEDWYQKQYGILPNYSHIIEQLTTTKEERVNLLKPFFEATEEETLEGIKKPTVAHQAIAKLIQKGYIRVIITTNFDRLMENALREIGIEATVISNPNHIENVMPLIHSPITIIKVNGDYLDTKFLNIEAELSSYENALINLIKYVFENFGLITTGWSAKWDIALREILETSNKFRFSNYFTYINNCDEELKSISNLRRGKLVQITSANQFFKEIFENVEALESGEVRNPLSKPIAVARLKKYVGKEEHKIALHELINEEVQAVLKSINVQTLPYSTPGAIKNVLEFEVKRVDLLCSLMIEGTYWGKTVHHDIWVKVLVNFSYPLLPKSSDDTWVRLAYFPTLILFYAIGLTALYKEDFLLLRNLFIIKVFNFYREGEKISIFKNVNTGSVIDKAELNSAYGKNYRVPMSELLYRILRPFFVAGLVHEKEFDKYFDSFELLISLQYIEKMGKDWCPLGRFINRRHDNNIVANKFEDLNKLQENLDWINEGLFTDSNKLLECYIFLNEQIKRFSF